MRYYLKKKSYIINHTVEKGSIQTKQKLRKEFMNEVNSDKKM